MTEFYFQILCFLFFPTCPVKVSTSPPQEQIEYLWFQMFRCMSLIVCCLCLSGQLQQIQSHPQPQQLSRCSAVVRIMSLLSGIGVQSCPPLPLSYPGDVCCYLFCCPVLDQCLLHAMFFFQRKLRNSASMQCTL